MREIISPLKNPKWRWIRGPTRFQHLREGERGLEPTIEARRDKYHWISDVEIFFLNPSGSKLLEKRENDIICHSFKFFGRESIVQSWGFASDFDKEEARMAVCFGGKWYLVEKGDELMTDAGEEPPFTEVNVFLKSRHGHKSVTIYKK